MIIFYFKKKILSKIILDIINIINGRNKYQNSKGNKGKLEEINKLRLKKRKELIKKKI